MADLSTSATAIVGLLDPRSPIAIVGLIAPVIVQAFDGVLRRRPRAHVSEEQHEIAPSIADRNPSRAIAREALAIRVAASLKHGRPYGVFRNSFSARGLPMLEASARQRLAVKASARASAPGAQIVAHGKGLSATIAETIPRSFFGVVGERYQATKPSISDVNKAWHPSILTISR